MCLKVADVACSWYHDNNFLTFLCMTILCIWFYRELNTQSFENKTQFETMKSERDIDKIVRPSFFMAHPLVEKNIECSERCQQQNPVVFVLIDHSSTSTFYSSSKNNERKFLSIGYLKPSNLRYYSSHRTNK